MGDTDPQHYPAYRPPSRREQPKFRSAEHRGRSGAAFRRGASTYHDVRPGYPDTAIELLTTRLSSGARVADIGAGTGILTRQLVAADLDTWAIEPSRDMARTLRSHLNVPLVRARAEATGLGASIIDAACLAQTWHWVDTQRACVELDRLVAPGGAVLLVWNTLDVADPWVLRLARIMHSGDVLAEGFRPAVADPWEIAEEWRGRWADELHARDVFTLTATRSYWLRANEKTRRRVRGNLEWYLYEHSGLRPESPVALPYRTDAFLLFRRGDEVPPGSPPLPAPPA